MATTIDEVKGFLDEHDLKYGVDEGRNAILVGFECNAGESVYRDVDGDPSIRIVIQVLEQGAFLTVCAPNAWNIAECPHKPAVFEALTAIQMQFKMLRFDYDPTDGELRPNVELPIEDSSLTSRQLHRMIHGILGAVERFHPVIRHAMEHGEVSFDCLEDQSPGSPSGEMVRLLDLARRAGGIESLERLVGGDASQ